MSNDKRTVATDALETLGTIIGENEKRDAIHLAVEPVTAKVALHPGDGVSANGDRELPWVGIVDPFLTESVKPGERFWLVIYPRQINSLRHVWTHPAFPDEIITQSVSKDHAEGRLREITRNWDGPDYDSFIELATTGTFEEEDGYGSYAIDGDYIYSYGRDAYGDIPPEVWDYVEIITGKKVKARPTGFTCSC